MANQKLPKYGAITVDRHEGKAGGNVNNDRTRTYTAASLMVA